jgi:hypothetical protein
MFSIDHVGGQYGTLRSITVYGLLVPCVAPASKGWTLNNSCPSPLVIEGAILRNRDDGLKYRLRRFMPLQALSRNMIVT